MNVNKKGWPKSYLTPNDASEILRPTFLLILSHNKNCVNKKTGSRGKQTETALQNPTRFNSRSSTRETAKHKMPADTTVIFKISKNKRKIKIEPAQGISKVRYHGNINAGSPKKHKLIFSCMSG